MGLALLGAWACPQAGGRLFRALERAVARLAARRLAAYALVLLAPMVVRALLLPWIPVPQPLFHDEFSYWLGADMLRHGRLAMEPHPFRQHFETFHVLQEPRYFSMYPPGQAAAMAAGWLLAGHPWWGVLATSMAMCAAMVWALAGILPFRWALAGGLLLVVRIAVLSYWTNSYWGGSLAAAAGALVTGATLRFMVQPRARWAAVFVLGATLLALRRPYEGLLLTAICSLVLGFWWLRRDSACRRRVLARTGPVFVLGGAATLSILALCNLATTGNALQWPYQVAVSRFTITPPLLFLPPRPGPAGGYASPQHREFARGQLAFYRAQHTWQGYRNIKFRQLLVAFNLLIRYAGLIPLAAGLLLWRRRKWRWVIAASLLLAASALAQNYLHPHYLAPYLALWWMWMMGGLRRMRSLRVAGKPAGLWLMRACFAIAWIVFLVPVAARVAGSPLPGAGSYFPCCGSGAEHPRHAVERDLLRIPGRHLVFVHYGPDHSPHTEWVYNAALIDRAPIVWARTLGEEKDARLMDYFADRHVWRVEADAPLPQVRRLR